MSRSVLAILCREGGREGRESRKRVFEKTGREGDGEYKRIVQSDTHTHTSQTHSLVFDRLESAHPLIGRPHTESIAAIIVLANTFLAGYNSDALLGRTQILAPVVLQAQAQHSFSPRRLNKHSCSRVYIYP